MSLETQRAVDLSSMLNSPGWRVSAEIAEQILKDLEKQVILCEDESQIIALQRRAHGARVFYEEWKAQLVSASHVESEFQTVAM